MVTVIDVVIGLVLFTLVISILSYCVRAIQDSHEEYENRPPVAEVEAYEPGSFDIVVDPNDLIEAVLSKEEDITVDELPTALPLPSPSPLPRAPPQVPAPRGRVGSGDTSEAVAAANRNAAAIRRNGAAAAHAAAAAANRNTAAVRRNSASAANNNSNRRAPSRRSSNSSSNSSIEMSEAL